MKGWLFICLLGSSCSEFSFLLPICFFVVVVFKLPQDNGVSSQ